MELCKHIKFFGAVFALLPTICFSAQDRLITLRSDFEDSFSQYQKTLDEIQNIETRLDRISMPRQASETKNSLVSKLPYQKSLQEAESLTRSLETKRLQSEEKRKQALQKQNHLLVAMDQHLADLAKDLRRIHASSKSFRKTLLDMQEVYEEKQKIMSKMEAESFEQLPLEISTAPSASTAETLEQISAVEDIERKLSKQIQKLQQQKITTQRQAFMMKEVSALLREEIFFGEQNFVSNASRRSQISSSSLSSTLKKSPQDIDPNGVLPESPPSADAAPSIEESNTMQEGMNAEGVEIDSRFHPRKGIESEHSSKGDVEFDTINTTEIDQQLILYQNALERLKNQKEKLQKSLVEKS